MKRFFFTIGLAWVMITAAFAQVDTKRIKEQAELTADALLQEDYETLIKFTYPKLLEMLGGGDKMTTLIKKGKIEMTQQGISFDKVTIGNPSDVVKAGEELHCLVPQTIFMKVPNGRMKMESHLLAISKDDGQHWFFIDTVNMTLEKIRGVIPNYNADLKLPAKKQPVFIAD